MGVLIRQINILARSIASRAIILLSSPKREWRPCRRYELRSSREPLPPPRGRSPSPSWPFAANSAQTDSLSGSQSCLSPAPLPASASATLPQRLRETEGHCFTDGRFGNGHEFSLKPNITPFGNAMIQSPRSSNLYSEVADCRTGQGIKLHEGQILLTR